jgi:hypothetical protein
MIAVSKQKHQSDNEVSEVIDKVLRQTFGKEATLLIYKYLEKSYSLRQDEIAEKIDVFAKGLEETLRSGAYVIEKMILDDIYSSYGFTRSVQFERIRKNDFVNQMKTLRA